MLRIRSPILQMSKLEGLSPISHKLLSRPDVTMDIIYKRLNITGRHYFLYSTFVWYRCLHFLLANNRIYCLHTRKSFEYQLKLRMPLCSCAMQIMRVVGPTHFRLIRSSWRGAGPQVSGGERLTHSLVVPFPPLSLLLYFSHSHYYLWGFLVELSTISQEEKIIVDKCMMSGTKKTRVIF